MFHERRFEPGFQWYLSNAVTDMQVNVVGPKSKRVQRIVVVLESQVKERGEMKNREGAFVKVLQVIISRSGMQPGLQG